MKKSNIFLTAVLATLSLNSYAARTADLEVELIRGIQIDVYGVHNYEVHVSNIGRKDARNTFINIELPITNTSPQQHLLGEISNLPLSCSLIDTNNIKCALGKIRKFKEKSINFDLKLPYSTKDLEIKINAETSSAESNYTNNSHNELIELSYDSFFIYDGSTAYNRHCTGTSLTSFFECELNPSSIQNHEVDYLAGGLIGFPQILTDMGYTGTWSQSSGEDLVVEYQNSGNIVMEFSGKAVGDQCFEGVTSFPGSNYVSPYEICF